MDFLEKSGLRFCAVRGHSAATTCSAQGVDLPLVLSCRFAWTSAFRAVDQAASVNSQSSARHFAYRRGQWDETLPRHIKTLSQVRPRIHAADGALVAQFHQHSRNEQGTLSAYGCYETNRASGCVAFFSEVVELPEERTLTASRGL